MPVPNEASRGKQTIMVARIWGADRPGIAESFLKVVSEHDADMLDMSQFLVEDSLMFTIILSLRDKDPAAIIKEMTECAKKLSLQIETEIPASGDDTTLNENTLMMAIVSNKAGAISPTLLHDMDAILSAHGCVVDDIEHRSDNKLENNGEFTKVSVRIRCPKSLNIGALLLGGPSQKGAQTVAWEHGAEICVRRWDNMNRPNGKSLVVFGISNVLCPYDINNEVLKEAGIDPTTITSSSDPFSTSKSKAALLKGKSVEVVDKFIKRLEFTPGAHLLCSTLKLMGFRLAILTNSGCKAVAEHVKQQLNIDYMIAPDLEVENDKFTGQFSSEVSDVRFRKVDLLKLMADREAIQYKNVITVGEPLSGLKLGSARHMLDTFGLSVWFNNNKLQDLSIALYLLGLNGSEIRTLKKRSWEDGPVSATDEEPSRKRYRVQVSTKAQSPGQMGAILAPIQKPADLAQISTVRQCSLRDGGMVFGIDMGILKNQEERLIKEAVLNWQKSGFTVMETAEKTPGGKTQWQDRFKNRAVITLVEKPQVRSNSLRALFACLAQVNINIVKIERLSAGDLTAMAFSVTVPEDLPASKIKELLLGVSKTERCDLAFQKDDVYRWMRRLVVFDMDSTLIQQEVIDELAKYAGVEKQVKEITEAAMNGHLDFFGSLKARVALLKGQPGEELFTRVKKNLVYTPGAKKLCATLKSLGYKMAVISGGFLPVAREVQKHLGLDYAFANTLEVDEAGLLTGKTTGPVVTPQRKRALLATIADVEGCHVSQTIAVGDGANDIPMLHTAGLGIAFCAKPKVQDVAEFRINQKDLSTVMFLIGISEAASQRLGVEVSEEDLKKEGSASK